MKEKDINTILIAVGGYGKRIASDLKKREIKTSKIFLTLNDKPILSHLIDASLALGFQRIFLLSSYYENELRDYLKKNYPAKKQILPIYGGSLGRKWGVPCLLYSIREKLYKTFIYSDGNILYDKSVLKKIKKTTILQPALANIVLSRKDVAPTHSQFILQGKQIKSINTRLSNSKDSGSLNGRQYYSLGLMVLNKDIFSSVSGFSHKKDLDFVVRDIFEADKNLIKVTVYNANWIAVHTIRDIDKLGIKS